MALPSRHAKPGYPYEQLTPATVANIQRLRDEQTAELRLENDQLREELWRFKCAVPLLEEMGIDIDVMLATRQVFDAP